MASALCPLLQGAGSRCDADQAITAPGTGDARAAGDRPGGQGGRGSGPERRLDRLAATRGHLDLTELTRRIAEVEGLCATELLAGAEQIMQVCRQQGLTATEGMVQYWSAEFDMAPEELDQELVRYRELWT